MHPNLRRCLVLLVQRISRWTSYIWPEFIGRNSMEGINSAILSRFCPYPWEHRTRGWLHSKITFATLLLSVIGMVVESRSWLWFDVARHCDLFGHGDPRQWQNLSLRPCIRSEKYKFIQLTYNKKSFIYFNMQSKWSWSTLIFYYTCISHLYLYNINFNCINLLYLCIFIIGFIILYD